VLDQGRIVAEGTPAELKRLVPGGHIRLTFGDLTALGRAAVVLDPEARDDESLTLEVAGDDGVRSLKGVLDCLERAPIDVSDLSVQTGHVLGSLIQTMAAVLLVAAVALLIGFRPAGSPAGWLGALGVLTLIAFSVTWLSVAMGINAKSVETASNQPTFLLLMPFLGSGFVPTDSMPDVLRWFADVQPFTPFIETVRGLLMGTPVEAGTMLATIVWCAVMSVGGYVWALWLYNRKSVRA